MEQLGRIYKTIIFSLIPLFSFAQNDTTIVSEGIKKIKGDFYTETVTTTTNYQLVTSSMFADIESREDQKKRLQDEIAKGDAERKEKIKLLKQLVRKGFEPNESDWKEVEIFERVMKKIE